MEPILTGIGKAILLGASSYLGEKITKKVIEPKNALACKRIRNSEKKIKCNNGKTYKKFNE